MSPTRSSGLSWKRTSVQLTLRSFPKIAQQFDCRHITFSIQMEPPVEEALLGRGFRKADAVLNSGTRGR